jgi:hypothetical protein
MAVDACDYNDPVQEFLSWIVKFGIQGFGTLPPAEKVAADHLKACQSDREKAIDSIIAWRTTHAAGTGFVTGLGGLATLPLTIPVSFASSYALAANASAAIAFLRGYDIQSDQVCTFVLLTLIGQSPGKIIKTIGVNLGTQVTKSLVSQVPGKVLIGFKLITKVGEKGFINLIQLVPVAGGLVGAGFDGMFVNYCGYTAKNVFSQID